MGLIGLGDDHQAGCFLVEPVDYARAPHAANARQTIAAMGNEGVDQCAGPIACCRVNNEACRFVDDDQLIVFINHVQRNILRTRNRIFRLRNGDGDLFARFDPVVRLQYLHTVGGRLTLFNQRLVAAAAKFRELETQKAINSVTGVIVSNGRGAEKVAHRGIMAMSDSAHTDRPVSPGEPDIPENPLGTPKNMRRLKMAIAIMTFLLVAGTLVVIGTIIYRAMNYEGNRVAKSSERVSKETQGFSKLDVEVDPGTLVTQIEIDGDRMAVHVTRASVDEILIINIRTGELIGRVDIKERKRGPRGEQ